MLLFAVSIQASADDQNVAVVNGQTIKTSELESHMSATQLGREQAVEDLIDLQLVRSAAIANKIKAPSGAWSTEARTEVEYALAKALKLDVPSPRIYIVVDHAWIKDAASEKERADTLALLVKLRDLVKAGSSIPAAFDKLVADGSSWHIGDHEEYPYDVIAPEARDLPPGSLSEILPGDEGKHLFKIYAKKEQLPSSAEFRYILNEHLRKNATITVIDQPEEK
jgi:hypothetical protein